MQTQTRNTDSLTRAQALEMAARLGVKDKDVYLLDAIPAIAMCWADGEIDPHERAVVERFVERRIHQVNRMASLEVLTPEDGQRFLNRFFEQRLPEGYFRLLTQLVKPVCLKTSDLAMNRRRRQEIMGVCLEVAAAASAPGDGEKGKRISPEEQAWLEELSHSL
jgi:anti-sigma factor RsiW